ncbi:Nucleoporin NUP82 [Hyphodiscus hymeniophilus]|uniref:Nucleoporin NUP82 n=1 Tax=Hyphodiscus hymeniophilus TaxID=353542 RepID=A0A9P6VGI7_9HELO|nr:Nucleoporin NUP82 [Hyphodiscus hymeniophilus]
MPKITSYTPAWLSKPSPGHDLFTAAPSSQSLSATSKKASRPGPRRTIAYRGVEVFIAVGKEIRWADLVYLREVWEDKEQKKRSFPKGRGGDDNFEEGHAQGYRTIKVPVADDIKQLIISPSDNYLAILTTHTVHIAVLPESSHLTAPDTGPLRLKTYTLGPTTHVTSQSGVASALWHPLGVNGTCLVTVTNDAVVRVWELSTADRWSFDRPTLAIDLQKLADGTSLDEDFGASVSGMRRGFSADSFEMEVASACFASRGSGGWSPMTLWIAMREGDVYALCPLLPEKWSPPPTLIPSLSVSIVAKDAAMEDDPTMTQKDMLLAQQQLAWMSDIDIQEPIQIEGNLGEAPAEVYMRPSKPGRVPKLQGPFDFELAPQQSQDELDGLLSDIYVIGTKMDADELMDGEDDDLEKEENQEGLSMSVVCLLMSSGRVSICLDIDGVEAQWLPKMKSKVTRYVQEEDAPTLVTFHALDTTRETEVWEGNWPMFSPDCTSRYSFYVTNTSSVTFVSLSSWAFGLERELSEGGQGTDFRVDLLAKQWSIRERIHTQKMEDHSAPLAACAVTYDPDLGYLLLTATSYGPVAVFFDPPEVEFELFGRERSPTYDSDLDKPLILYHPRPVYEPAHALEISSALPSLLDKLKHGKYKRLLQEEVRLSAATLTIMTDAHKLLSDETHKLGTAAAELFRRCARLQQDLRSQIQKANEIASRVETVTGRDVEEGPAKSSDELMAERIKAAQDRQQEITTRIEKLRKRSTKGTSRELSDKERAWVEEVNVLNTKVFGGGEENRSSRAQSKEPWARYEMIEQVNEELMEQMRDLSGGDEVPSSPIVKVPSEIRKVKMGQVMSLLDRESALVEGAKNRLEKLSLS